MGYQSRKRDYLTPREKNAKTWRNARITLLFILMAAIVWVIKDWDDYWGWLKTFFYS